MAFDIRSFIKEVSDKEEEEISTTPEPDDVVELNHYIENCPDLLPEYLKEEVLVEATGESCTVASFLQKGEESRVERYQRMSARLSKREKRVLEQKLLKPEALPTFVGTRPAGSAVEERTVKIIFETDEDLELFKRFFRVNNYKGQNTRDVDIIVALVEALDRGSLEYNASDKTLNFVTDSERIVL